MRSLLFRRKSHAGIAGILTFTLFACADHNGPIFPDVTASKSQLSSKVFGEGELLGNIYDEAGQRTTDTRYYFKVIAEDLETAARLNPNHFSNTMWADPSDTTVWMLNYTDPNGGGLCGRSEQDYMNGAGVYPEAHRPGPGLAPSGLEKHCIRPGKYRIQLIHNGSVVPGREFVIDYLAVAKTGTGSTLQITNQSRSGLIEYVEPANYDKTNPWTDTYLHFDLTGVGGHTETAVLHAQNIGTDTLKTSFTDDATLSGYDAEYFRFSVAASSTSWDRNGGQVTGEYLARLFYDVGFPNSADNQTNYYDPRSEYDPANSAAGVMRLHSFGTHVESSRMATVALEIKTPAESSDGPTNTSRPVSITRFACSPTFQSASSFRGADQYVGIGCSERGTNIRYSWEFEPGQWSPETADTLFDFLGYAALTPNPRPVRLKARSIAPGGITSISPPSFISLIDSVLTVTGPSDVWDKTTKTHTSNRPAQWFVRHNPDLDWFVESTQYVSSIQRIWPAGDYTVEVRGEDLRNSGFRRGRQSVTVTSGAMLSANSIASSNESSSENWGFFGGGPWISSGTAAAPRLLRFYELMGMHDQPSRFVTRDWVTALNGPAMEQANGFGVAYTRSATLSKDALLFDFTVTLPSGGGNFVFGMALDPDIGSSAADDESGYDASRGLVYAMDNSAAVGYMLLKGGKNAIYSVDQFGTRRFAPRQPNVAWQLQRTAGARLQNGRSDVQFVLSAAPASTATTYTVVLLRGATVAELQVRADEVLVNTQ